MYLSELGLLTEAKVEEIKEELRKEIQDGLDIAYAEPNIIPNTEEEVADLFAENPNAIVEGTGSTREMRLIDAVQDGLRLSMRKHKDLIIMGQDIADYGGVFKVTEGFMDEFGKDRVRNTPICESAIVGSGLGLSIAGMKAVVEMQFADFVTCGFNQIINNLAKIHWRWGQNADVVVRMPTGAGSAAGPFHSQSNEAWFFHTPGLKVVYPSSPSEAKGLLMASIDDPNPVLFFEHKNLYRSIKEEVFETEFSIEIGKAAVKAEGSKLSIITYGFAVHWALDLLDEYEDGTIEIIDLRTLLPLDTEAIYSSIRKTGRALILHEDCLTGGIGGEIAALINENCFEVLDAPVRRLASLDTPVPFAPELEANFLPKEKLKEAIDKILGY